MPSLVLTHYSKQSQRLETINSFVSEQLLYSHLLRSLPLVMLKGDATNLFKTECMMRGLPLNLIEVEPDKHVQLSSSAYILHQSNEFVDFNLNDEVWICSPTT